MTEIVGRQLTVEEMKIWRWLQIYYSDWHDIVTCTEHKYDRFMDNILLEA